jgi:uncharacterized membrane protein
MAFKVLGVAIIQFVSNLQAECVYADEQDAKAKQSGQLRSRIFILSCICSEHTLVYLLMLWLCLGGTQVWLVHGPSS